jgi:predicted TIM-barrel fold metal-dependent hydrolase
VWGRIPHGGAGLREPVTDTSAPREVVLARKAIEAMGVDYQVMFTGAMLTLGAHPVPETEAALAGAFNRWMVEKILPHDPRIKAFLYVPFNAPEAAEATVKRYLGAKGVAGFLVSSTRFKPVHSNAYMRLYKMLEESGQVIAFHAANYWQDQYTTQLNRFISMHAISFVLCNIVHMTNWVINGMPIRFPKLKVLWVESGLSWLPFLMQRLDSEYMMRSSEAPLLKAPPSHYMREMFYTMQPMEQTDPDLLKATFKAINAPTQLLYASDWPHWDFDLPSKIWDLDFIDEQAKRNILGLNAARLFGFEVPAKYKTTA